MGLKIAWLIVGLCILWIIKRGGSTLTFFTGLYLVVLSVHTCASNYFSFWVILCAFLASSAVWVILTAIASEHNRKPTSPPPAAPADPGTLIWERSLLSESDSQWAEARYSSGTVFFTFKYSQGEKPIGYYQRTGKNTVQVLHKDDRGEVGIIDTEKKQISLSRMAIYERHKEMAARSGKWSANYPVPDKMVVAEIADHNGSGYICDYETNQIIARYTGGMIGAAAAFVALTSELHLHTKYHNWQSDWEHIGPLR